ERARVAGGGLRGFRGGRGAGLRVGRGRGRLRLVGGVAGTGAGGQAQAGGTGQGKQAGGHGDASVSRVDAGGEAHTSTAATRLPSRGPGCCLPSKPAARTAANRSNCSSTTRPATSNTSKIAACAAGRSWWR